MHILICQHRCYIVIIMTVFEDLCEHTISNISLLSIAVRRRITLHLHCHYFMNLGIKLPLPLLDFLSSA